MTISNTNTNTNTNVKAYISIVYIFYLEIKVNYMEQYFLLFPNSHSCRWVWYGKNKDRKTGVRGKRYLVHLDEKAIDEVPRT